MANSVIGALRVMLGMDTAEFEDGANRAERSANRLQKDLAKTASNLQKTGQTLSLALTAPLIAFGASAFKAASDAAELQSAFNQTFGELAGAMNQWAEQTGDAMGRSTQSMQELANTFGIFFNQAAPTREEAAKMSQTFSVLAQDLASFYNVTESEALAKLRSGLSGESEPLRDFGVFLSEAAVQSKALELGLAGINNPLTEQEKIMARYAIILEQTKNAQGDVGRTSGGTANQIRAAQAAFQELEVTVGTKLLPVLTPLIEKLASALEWFSQLPEPVQNFTLGAVAVGAALGPVLIGLGSIVKVAGGAISAFRALKAAFDITGLLKNLIPMIVQLGRVMLALVASNPLLAALAVAIGLAFAAWQNWDKIEPILRRLYEGVKKWLVDNLGPIFEWVGKKIQQVTGFFYNMYDAVVGNSYVPDMVEGIAAEFAKLQTLMVDPAEQAATATKDAFRQMASEVMSLLDQLFPEIARARKMAADLDLLDKAEQSGVISEELRRRARQRVLAGEYGDKAKTSFDDNPEGPLAEVEKVKEAIEAMNATFETGAKKTEVQTVRIAETVKDMAQKISSSLRGLVDGIKSGDFFDIFDGILNIVSTLGQAGAFGSKFQSFLGSVPGFANGGAMQLGGFAGIDRNVLSLNGSPIARVSRGETMEIRNGGARGGATVVNNYYTLPSDEFWSRVDGRAGAVVGAAAPVIEQRGAGRALKSLGNARRGALA